MTIDSFFGYGCFNFCLIVYISIHTESEWKTFKFDGDPIDFNF
jgi:hypothetical protein